MLSVEENEFLTRVGPGTPVGEYLRRYWAPACLSAEIPTPGCPPVRVRLLGEDLVAFRDERGRPGLLAEACPHRGASLYFGRNESAPSGECGLRCVYHGWQFDVEGNCIDMPSEPRPFAERIKAVAYPVHESGGMIWTYMGPRETMTPFRDFGTDSLTPDQVSVTKEHIACNFVQSLEGDIDSAHISHLHQFFAIDDIPDDGTDRPGYPSNYMSMRIWRHDRAPRIEVHDTWYGFRYAALRRTPNGHTQARITAFIAPYTALIASVPFRSNHLTIVPSDDHNTWRYTYATTPPLPKELAALGGPGYAEHPAWPYRTRPPVNGIIQREHTLDNDYNIDRDAQRHVSQTGIPEFRSHDLMVTESMGPVYSRANEHLGTTDLAVTRMRAMLVNGAKAVAAGEDPVALAGNGDFRTIRAAEKILESDEDWRILGTDDDPLVRQTLLAEPGSAGS